MIAFKPTLLPHHCFLHFALVLCLVFVTKPQLTRASTLVIEGYKLNEVSRDSSTLATGYQSPINSAGNGCSWNTYYESCYGYGGTVVFDSQDRGTSYSINGKTVTFCSRYKRISFCTSNGLSTTNTSYGGVKITYNLVANAGKVAAVYISNERSDACTGVCTDTNGQLSFPVDSKSSCDSYPGGWAAVNDDYYDTCAPPKETCSELVVSKGCEDSETRIVGTYYPTTECSDNEDPDQTRSIYYSSDVDKYLFYRSSSDDWVFSAFCSDFFVYAYLDAGDEPYLNAANEVLCYDGGFTSNKKFTYTDLMMKCKRVSSGSSSFGGGNGGGNGGTVAGIIIGFLVVIGFVASIYIVIKKRRNSGGTMMTSLKKMGTGGVNETSTGTETRAAPLAQPVFPVTPAQEASTREEEGTAISAMFGGSLFGGSSSIAQQKTSSSLSVLETAPVPVAPPLAADVEQETTFTTIAPPQESSQTADQIFAADRVQVEEGGGDLVAKTDTYERLQGLEKIKPLLTKKEYKMKRMEILGDL